MKNSINIKYQNYFNRTKKLSPSLKFGYSFMKRLWNYLTDDLPVDKDKLYADYQKIFLYGYWPNKEVIPKEYYKTIEEIKNIILERESWSPYTFVRLNSLEAFIKFNNLLNNLLKMTTDYEILPEEDFWHIVNHYKQKFALNKTQYKLITQY